MIGCAKVFYYCASEKRTRGAEFGMMHILNRTYIAWKHSHADSRARRRLMRFLYYKIGRYLLQSHTKYGHQRLRGVLQGLSLISQLLDALKEELSKRYAGLRAECLDRLGFQGSM